ncbi:hypothetical protein AB0K15_11560 [Amycolatopsis sp. NPDC049253]|uniref:hypothetical protein n=1 Tax=Amycolatopsis sp. NPDC049253 TaxID=3155274 RepID=UPI003448A967
MGAAVGPARAYPEIDTDALLNARGKQAFAEIGAQCIAQFTVGQAFRRMRDYTTVPQLLGVPAVQRVIAENTMGRFKPGSPLYVYQACSTSWRSRRRWTSSCAHTARRAFPCSTAGSRSATT